MNFGAELESGRRHRKRNQLKESPESIQRVSPLTKEEVGKLKSWLDESKQDVIAFNSVCNLNTYWEGSCNNPYGESVPAIKRSLSSEIVKLNTDDFSVTDNFIAATTKPCPSCGFRATHYHGHACHHISPGQGCPRCHTHYCYMCRSTAAENLQLRGKEQSCRCGSWSSFCSAFRSREDVQNYLTCQPYPHDNRCGCVICPDCRFGSPCSMCPGQCDVCLGYINPGIAICT